MDIKFIIFEIVFSLTTYFVGYFLGRRMAMKDFFAQAYGAVVESDMDTDEIIAVTYYYSEEAFEERKNRTPDDWILEEDEMNIEFILEKYSFDYFHVTIKPGYYEGFTLDIENNFSVAFDGWKDKRAAQLEITSLKKCLLECAGVGMVECWPGWCTKYNDYKGTCKAIGAAIKVMRDEVNSTPTWTQYARANA